MDQQNEPHSQETVGGATDMHPPGRSIARFWKFLRQQCEGRGTRGQVIFDLIFGVVAPIVCLIFDPIVFRSNIPPLNRANLAGGVLGAFTVLAYVGTALEVLMLLTWIFVGVRLKLATGFVAGMLAVGAVLSCLIGIALLPLTLIGLPTLIGLLGFVPFVTAYVYYRSAMRAFRAAKMQAGAVFATVTLGIGFLIALAIPTVPQVKLSGVMSQALEQVRRGDPQSAGEAVQIIKRLRWFGGTRIDQILWDYEEEKDTLRKEFLAAAYKEITGTDIEERLQSLRD